MLKLPALVLKGGYREASLNPTELTINFAPVKKIYYCDYFLVRKILFSSLLALRNS
jgi:hypothetical protein